MKRLLPITIGLVLAMGGVFCLVAPCDAENQVLKRECETKAKNAAGLIQTMGAKAAFGKITDPQGSFVSNASHVFCIDAESGSLLAHKVARFVGSNMNYYMDADGKNPYARILRQARQRKEGWSSYMSYGSGPEKRDTPGLKNMYFLKVPGKNIVLCCGYWEDA